MGTVSAVVSSFNKAFNHELFDVIEYNGERYYEFALRPSWSFSGPSGNSSGGDYVSGDAIPKILIPAECVYFSPKDDIVKDIFKGSSVNYSNLRSRLGRFGVVELKHNADVIVKDPAHLLFSDDGEHRMSGRDAFAYLTASMECGLFGDISPNLCVSNFDNIVQSCRDCFADESPAYRVVRDVELNQSPVEFADRHRLLRMERRDYSNLPPYSGFADLNHTVVRKDFISPEIIDVKGIPCRRVSVPTAGAFRSDNLDAKHLYSDVYIPADCFWSMPRDFGAADASPDFDEKTSKSTNRFSKKSPIRSRYSVCSIPDNVSVFMDEFGSDVMDTSHFSAMMTCLNSCHLCYNNLLYDSSRFDRLYDMVMSSRSGGAHLTQAELLYDAPMVDFDIVDGVAGRYFTPPTRKTVQEVYEKSSMFSHGAPYGSDEPWDLNDRSGLSRVFSGALSVLSKSQIDFTKLPSVENAPSSEEFDPEEGPNDGTMAVGEDYETEFAEMDLANTEPVPGFGLEPESALEPESEPEPELVSESSEPEPESELAPVFEQDFIPESPPVSEPPPVEFEQDFIPEPSPESEPDFVQESEYYDSYIDGPPPPCDDDIPPEPPPMSARDMSDIDAAMQELDLFNGFGEEYDY